MLSIDHNWYALAGLAKLANDEPGDQGHYCQGNGTYDAVSAELSLPLTLVGFGSSLGQSLEADFFAGGLLGGCGFGLGGCGFGPGDLSLTLGLRRPIRATLLAGLALLGLIV
jgi:hypothetical protein